MRHRIRVDGPQDLFNLKVDGIVPKGVGELREGGGGGRGRMRGEAECCRTAGSRQRAGLYGDAAHAKQHDLWARARLSGTRPSPSGKEGHRRGRAIGQGAGRRAVKKARIGMDRKTFRSGNDAREYEMTSSCTCVRGARAAAPAISGAPGRSWRPGGRADAQSSGC